MTCIGAWRSLFGVASCDRQALSLVLASSYPQRDLHITQALMHRHWPTLAAKGLTDMRLFEGTEFDRPPRCNECGELEADCQCPPHPPLRIPPVEQTARVSVEKRKKGKFVTAVHGLPGVGNDLPELLTKLKNACSAGGTLKYEVIEIQGKQSERVKEVLLQLGFNVKQ